MRARRRRRNLLMMMVGGGLMMVGVAGCEDKVPELAPRPKTTAATAEADAPVPPKELVVEDDVVGEGAEAATGDRVKVHYTGRLLKNNKKFDSSRDRDEPFAFTLGQGEVIKGWDLGVVGMKVGGKRKLTIPYDLAYGEAGSPPKIPAKAALVFDVELVAIESE
ncbi:MAG: FKBP-type peptidyl-prolyl cis-trans isomerase [Myxococcota bacterium]